MDRLTTVPLRIGEWRLDPQLGQISRGEKVERLEARTLRLLQYLANRPGETVSIEELLDNVWSGVVVTQDSVYQAVTTLRRLLGDDARTPSYIATVPRLGYRLVAPVSPWTDQPALTLRPPMKMRHKLSIGASVIGAVLAVFLVTSRAPAPKSVAVLPFLDLTTQEMNEEFFADGLTEEMINRLAKLPGFRVPSPTASFHYKGSGLPPARIAQELGVRYLLDGSLRESGETMRISARLVRADDGFVVWTSSYDVPKADRVKTQDDIAGRVAQAIDATVN
jgi:TolB-like protein/DNA-binding winged helix-turn-helix (wHTH) protein